jgi:hypothetical protein
LLQIFKIIPSVSTGWIMLPFWSVGTLTLWKRRLVLLEYCSCSSNLMSIKSILAFRLTKCS